MPIATAASLLVRRAGRASGSAREFVEALEPRVVLAAGFETINWGGLYVDARVGSWVVTFDEQQSMERAVTLARGAAAVLDLPVIEARVLGLGYSAQFTTRATTVLSRERVLEALQFMPGVKAIDPDVHYTTAAVPNDSRFGEQWWLDNTGQFIGGQLGTPDADIDGPEAWDRSIGSSSVIIGVIDTGVDYTHPDLADNIWINPGEVPGNGLDDDGNGFVDDVRGWDFGELDNDPQDDVVGHGTPVAGMIGAVGNNGLGVAGVAWNVSILPLKIADASGALSLSAIIGAHDYATMMLGRGVNIVATNNSYGGFGQAFYANAPTGFDAERDAIERFINAGGTFVASAGNSNFNNDNPQFTFFPTSYNIPGVISVAASDNNDGRASFSNYGPQTVDIAAPGVDTLTTAPGGTYTLFGGTSAAGPAVAGVVALMKSVKPNASAVEIREALINSADPLPAFQGLIVSGGRVNAAEALRIVGLDGPVVRRVTPGPVAPAPVSTIEVTFNKALNPALVSAGAVTLVSSGGDAIFGNGNDVAVAIASVALSQGDTVLTVTPVAVLGAETYSLTLSPSGFKDLLGNFLNGNSTSGTEEVYTFRAASAGTSFENNDTIATATPVAFDANGRALFTGVQVGDGLFGALDVDIYRIEMPTGGLIRAKIDARSLGTPSTLDSYLRLFNSSGDQIAQNDQFNGSDSLIDFFVTTGGFYYVGVSGFQNTSYDPDLGASGSSQSRGLYNLTVEIDLVEDDRRTFEAGLTTPVGIPEQGVVTSVINIADSRQILDVNVSVTINHTFVSDLRISLISPTGTEVVLVEQRGGAGQFQAIPAAPVATSFDDEAPGIITTTPAPWGGLNLRPEEPVADFDGERAVGDWTLRIEDLTALNTGTLHDWSISLTLENDIFGPFELNDTITTARDLTGVAGTGSATIDATIGDGGFGFFDVDLFRFTADAGATLTAVAASGGALNSGLRLFDAQGAEIKFANPEGTNSSQIENFVFAVGGTFYIGVSEAANTSGVGAYDPLDAASGAAAGTTGSYTLTVSVSQGVSDGEVVLSGTDIELGLSATGAVGASTVGLSFLGTEFLFDSTVGNPRAQAFFGAVASGNSFRNDGPGDDPDLPMAVTVESDHANRRVTTSGLSRGLQVERSLSFSTSGAFIVVDVDLTNASGAALTDVAWMEALNPEQGLNLSQPSSATTNDVLDGSPYVSGRFINNQFQTGLTIALAAPQADSRAMATAVDLLTTVRDPFQLIDRGVVDPNGSLADQLLALTFDVGVLNVGETASLRYFILMGATPDDALGLYTDLNAGSGEGHLAVDPALPAADADGLPTLPFALYMPSGFANGRALTELPLANLNSRGSRVVVIARYETGVRDQVLYDSLTDDLDGDGSADLKLASNSRATLTLSSPALYSSGTADNVASTIAGRLGVRKMTPYAIEVRSELPLAATSRHQDFGVSTGEGLTSTASIVWSFPVVTKGQGSRDFIVYQNTTDVDVKVVITFLRQDGGTPVQFTQDLGAFRRGGMNVGDIPAATLPAGVYGVTVTAAQPVVVAVSSFSSATGRGFSSLALPTTGALSGATPEGQFGVNTESETIRLLNVNSTAATVTLTFAFDNGSSYRHVLTVGASSSVALAVDQLPSFPSGRGYGVLYESTVPISVALPAPTTGGNEGSVFAVEARTLWAFAQGFRPGGVAGQAAEYLRVYNPGLEDAVIEIELRYTDGSTETFRRVAGARRVTEVDVQSLITGTRAESDARYGFTVKSATPFVAYLGRIDSAFAGSFGTLGTPLGLVSPVV